MARNISKLGFISNYITDQSLGFCEHIDVFLALPRKTLIFYEKFL